MARARHAVILLVGGLAAALPELWRPRRDGRPSIGSICCGVVDDDATGLGRGEESPDRTGGPEAPPAGVNRWILVAVPLLGAVLAVGGIWVAVRDAQTPIHGLTPLASSRAAGPNPRVVAELCGQPFSAQPDGISPDSPEITDVTAIDRTTVRVRWVDRSPYSDTIIIVYRVCGNGRTINAYFGNTAGTAEHPMPKATEYVFRGLDPATAPWCFRVKAITSRDLYSHQRCISPPR
jgi:hypothetical protein